MKYQDIVPFYQKLNFRCPKGTVDETFSCGKTPEEAKKNYEKIQKEKTKTSKQVPEKRAPTRMDAKDIIRRIQSGGKITLEEKNYVQRLLSGESPEPAKVDPAPIKKLETVIIKAKKETASGKVSTQTKKELKSTLETAKEFATKPKETNNPVMGNIPALINTSDAVLNSLSTKQKDVIEEYSSITHMPINSYLWSGKITNYDSEHKLSETQVKKKIKELDSIFDKSETPEDIVVYRGIPEETLAKMKDLFKTGVEYETPSYTSTTHNKDRAKTFARGKHNATMEIRIPKGSRALALENVSNFKAEKEVLIDRGAKFKVLEVKTKKIHGGAFSETKVIVEMIPNKKIKQNSAPLIKLSMKHPGNWSTADSLDTKIKKELESGVQDVLDVLKSVGYFKEDPKEVALNEAYKKIAQDIFDTHVKLNYNCPADEKIGSGKGSCSGNTDNKSSDVIPDIPKDIVLGKDFDTIRAAINRKEFNLKTTKKEGMYETTYRIMISPKKIPQNWKSKINSIDSTTTWYDPKYMKEVPFGNGKSTILKPINPEMEKVISLPSGKESGYLFRGMSYEEFENINKSGFIKTLAEYNFDFQGDMTFFADDKGTASNYASGFAPWQYGPTIDKPAVMIKIRDPGNHEPGATEGEIGIKGKIPADLIEEVYFGHPVSMTQGYTEIINDKFNKSVYKGNSSSYKATVAWESRPYKNQKQNANCKQEEKVGSGPGSCSGGLKDSIQPTKVDLHPKLDPGDYDGLLKASKAIRNDKSEPDRVLRRMMAEEVERKFIRETKEAVQATKESNDEFIKNSGNDTWNKLSSESQSAIRGYTASDYGVINSALAEGIERPEVALIKAAMKPLERETILYRGVSFDLPKEVTKFGTIWENKPFASCSTGSFIAEEAALGKLTHDGVAKIPTVLEILTSKNTKGFAVGKNSFHAVADAGSEVILDTGTKFQTLSVDKSGRIRKITVRVIDD